MVLVTRKIQFDRSLVINTQLQLGGGESPLGPNRSNGLTPVERVKLLKQGDGDVLRSRRRTSLYPLSVRKMSALVYSSYRQY